KNDLNTILDFYSKNHCTALLIKFHQKRILEIIDPNNIYEVLEIAFKFIYNWKDETCFLTLLMNKDGILQKIADDRLKLDIRLPNLCQWLQPNNRDLFLQYLKLSKVGDRILNKIITENGHFSLLNLSSTFIKHFFILNNLPKNLLKKFFDSNSLSIYPLLFKNHDKDQ